MSAFHASSRFALSTSAVRPQSPVAAPGPEARQLRVAFALACVTLMSLADLFLTLTYATTVGMSEANPLARAIMAADCPLVLALWKVSTLGLGMCILFRLRTKRCAEVGAWVCFAALAALMVHWVRYNDTVQTLTPAVATMAQSADPAWVRIGP